MGGIFLNPNGNNVFTELVNNRISKVFVDKTDFIGETINRLDSDLKFIAFTRPRRFGKTVMAQMLSSYYSKSADNRVLFSSLKIAGYKGEKIVDNQKVQITGETFRNRFDVIYIDMNTVERRYATHLKGEKEKDLADIADYLECLVIGELKEQSEFARILEENRIGNVGLTDALVAIHKALGITFVLIMDEWDLVYREYRDDPDLQKKFIDLLKGLFKSADGSECFSLAYLTGILPIKKYNSQSALNCFDEYNMLAPGEYASYFGFTEDEVAAIAGSPVCKVSQHELKEWYEGYKIKDVDIYNPNSVCKAVSRNECIGYWSGTSSNEEVIRLINLDFKGVKSDIIRLLEGIRLSFSSGGFQNDMTSINSRNDVICLLVCLGYLGCAETGDGRKFAYVPNREIRQMLISLVSGQKWSRRMDAVKRSQNLLNAILRRHDGNRVAQIIQEIHNSQAVSLYDYNTEEALTYCVMTGLQWATLDDYTAHREEQSGKGRVDLVYEPDNIEDPLILIEFKYGRSAETAIKQIKTKEYYKRYRKQYRNIILVGINYSRSSKNHQCLIERV